MIKINEQTNTKVEYPKVLTGPPGAAIPANKMKGRIPMRTCDACGKPLKGGISMGGALLCRSCEPGVTAEINRLQAEGKPVNAIAIARSIFRETYSAGNYLLRDIPEELWTDAKHKAVDKGMDLRELILDAIREYVSK
mgnify:CR=1 FL=1